MPVNNTLLTLDYSRLYKPPLYFFTIVYCIFSFEIIPIIRLLIFRLIDTCYRDHINTSHAPLPPAKDGILKKSLNCTLILENVSPSICSEKCPTLLWSLQLAIRKCDFLTECAQGRPRKQYRWQGDMSKRFGSQLQAFKTISGTWHTSLFKLRCLRNVRGLSLPSFSFVWAHLKFPSLIPSLFRLPVMGNWELRTNVWKILAIKKKSSEWPQSLPSP